jgi:hypothetical protein
MVFRRSRTLHAIEPDMTSGRNAHDSAQYMILRESASPARERIFKRSGYRFASRKCALSRNKTRFSDPGIGKRYAAFSSEVDTGSRQENALFQETRCAFRSGVSESAKVMCMSFRRLARVTFCETMNDDSA